MPFSYFFLISDYTREAKEPVKAAGVSFFIDVIGIGAVIDTGESDISQILVKEGILQMDVVIRPEIYFTVPLSA